MAASTAIRLPTDGIYPVATIAIAALAYGLAEVAHGSGLLAIYLTALALGSAPDPRPSHRRRLPQGLGWVAQLSLFILLGLLVFPCQLDDVAREGPGALRRADPRRPPACDPPRHRPVAAERARAADARLGRPARRDPDLARHLPVVAGIAGGEEQFAIVFFVVVTSTLVQGASFEPLAQRLGLTTDEPALPRRLLESGRIRRMGGDVIAYRMPEGAAMPATGSATWSCRARRWST